MGVGTGAIMKADGWRAIVTLIYINFTVIPFESWQKLQLLTVAIFGQIDGDLSTFTPVAAHFIVTSAPVLAGRGETLVYVLGAVISLLT